MPLTPIWVMNQWAISILFTEVSSVKFLGLPNLKREPRLTSHLAIMGLKKDLKFKGNDFSNVASAYAIAHLLMQGPNGRNTCNYFLIFRC
jgi:hypothetical protein